MSVSLLMGLGLLGLLVLLVLFLVGVLIFSGRSRSQPKGRHSGGQKASQAVPVNVFQRGVNADLPSVPSSVVPGPFGPVSEPAVPNPGYRPAFAMHNQAQHGRSALAPELVSEPAVPNPGYRPAVAIHNQVQHGRSALAPELGGPDGTTQWYPGLGAARPPEDGN